MVPDLLGARPAALPFGGSEAPRAVRAAARSTTVCRMATGANLTSAVDTPGITELSGSRRWAAKCTTKAHEDPPPHHPRLPARAAAERLRRDHLPVADLELGPLRSGVGALRAGRVDPRDGQ